MPVWRHDVFCISFIEAEVSCRVTPYDFAHLMRMTLEPDALLTHAYCFIHNKCCGYERADSHHAGPSCIEFSAMGAMAGLEGPGVMALGIWLGMRCKYTREEV